MEVSPDAAGSWLQLFDKFGVSICFLGLFIVATGYILRRLLNDKNGIFTNYARNVTEQQKQLQLTHQQLADTVGDMAQTDSQVASVLEKMEGRLGQLEDQAHRIEQMHRDPHSPFATVALSRCFRHGCDILSEIAAKLEIQQQIQPQLALMKNELEQALHRMSQAATPTAPPPAR